MNSRLKKILENNECRGGQFLDDYNQTVYDDIAPTITTRIIESCHYFIYEDDKSDTTAGENGVRKEDTQLV